jgi:hypothetical protein
MHIAVCRLAEPYGYFRQTGTDAEGWPGFEVLKPFVFNDNAERENFMKEAIIRYLKEDGLID